MTQVLESWLKKRLGLCIKLNTPDVGTKLYNGAVYYRLLKNYNIINDKNIKEPLRCVSTKEAMVNLTNMCPWFKMIGLRYSKQMLKDVANKNYSSCLRLLFDLYNTLEDKNNLELLTIKKNMKQNEIEQLFKAEQGDILPFDESLTDRAKSLSPKLGKKAIIDDCIKELHNRRGMIMESLENQNQKVLDTMQDQTSYKEWSPSELKQSLPSQKLMEKLARSHRGFGEFFKKSPQDYINTLSQKKRKNLENEVWKLKMQNTLLHNLWVALLSRQEEEFEKTFRDKLKKQAEYEKRLAIKLAKTHDGFKSYFDEHNQPKKVIPSHGEREEEEGEEEEPIVKNEYLRKKADEIGMEKATIMELHNRLFNERIEKKKQAINEMCRQIVQDIADIAILASEQEKETSFPVTRRTMNNWKDLFYKAIPFFDVQPIESSTKERSESPEPEVEDEMTYEEIKINDSNALIDLEFMDKLNKFLVHSYLYLVGPWMIENWPELGDDREKLNITGYDIHKLLETKYPLPDLPQSESSLNRFTTRIILQPVKDSNSPNVLQILLAKSKLAVVQMVQAANFCLEAYEAEMNMELTKNLKLDHDFMKGSKRFTSTSRKKSSSTDISAKKHKKTIKNRIITENKAVQCPSTDDITKRDVYSNAAMLGQLIFESLMRQEPLHDILLCKMLIEYLKSLKDYNGFVLINFPTTYSQAVLLEFLITGQPINLTGKVAADTLTFLNSHLHPPYTVDTSYLMHFDKMDNKFITDTALEVLGKKPDPVPSTPPTPPRTPGAGGATTQTDPNDLQPNDETLTEFSTATMPEDVEEEEKDIHLSGRKKQSVRRSVRAQSHMKGRRASMRKRRGSKQDPEAEARARQATMNNFLRKNYLTDGIKLSSYEELMNLRMSKILPRPNKLVEHIPLKKTYFTKFFATAKEVKEKEKEKVIIKEEKDKIEMEKSEEKLKPDTRGTKSVQIEKPPPQTPHSRPTSAPTPNSQTKQTNQAPANDSLDSKDEPTLNPAVLYRKFRIYKYIEYASDLASSKRVARVLLGEPTDVEDLKRKRSSELFGQEAIEALTKLRAMGQLRSSIFGKAKTQDHSKGRKSEKRQTKFQKQEFVEEIDEIEEEIDEPAIETPTMTPVEPEPGDIGWDYPDAPIPIDVQIHLASLWEVVEHVYLSNLYQIMHLLRVQNAKLIPYINFLYKLTDDHLNIQDDRSNIVHNFQIIFNDVDSEFRKEAEMKSELHCKAYDLYILLCEMADRQKKIAQNNIKTIFKQGWIYRYVGTVVNLFICLMQIELDRFIDTVQILTDYYVSTLGNKCEEQRFQKTTLKKVSFSNEFESPSEETMPDQLESPEDRKNFGRFKTDENFSGNFTNHYNSLKSAILKCLETAHSLHLYIKSMIKDESYGRELRFQLKENEKRKRKMKTERNSFLTQLDQSSDPVLSSSNLKESEPPSEQILTDDEKTVKTLKKELDLIDRIKWEWDVAIANEVDRLHFRLRLIESKTKSDMEEAIGLLMKTFEDFNLDIGSKYHREILAIEDVYKVFKSAIEDGKPIDPIVGLIEDKFYPDINKSLYPEIAVPPPSAEIEVCPTSKFTIEQLQHFVEKMSQVSPFGVIENPFVAILEDMAAYTNNETQYYLPLSWAKLTKENFQHILEQAFGTSGIYDWRDFVLFVSNIPFPPIEELIDLKNVYRQIDLKLFETINYKEFMRVPLWFENKFKDKDESALLKNLLFKMYQVNKNEINYSAMLLAFCKGEDSLDGFMRAVTLVDNKGIMLNAESYMEEVMNKREHERIANEILIKILTDVLEYTEGTVVKTLPRNWHDVEEATGEEEGEVDLLNNVGDELSLGTSSHLSQVTIGIHPEPEEPRMYPERFNHPKWNICIPYETALNLLVFATNYYLLKPEHDQRISLFVKRLHRLFKNEDKGGYLKLCQLVQSDFVQELFESTGAFKYCHLTNFVDKMFL